MKRWFKALGIILSAVVMLVAVSLFLPDRIYLRAAESITRQLTDRDLHIGSLNIQRGLQTVIEMSDVSFSNAEWSDKSAMIEAERLTATINLRALLQGMVEISSLSLNGLKLQLEKHTKGQFNWQLTESESESEKSAVKQIRSRIKLIELSANNNLIEYIDHPADVQHTIELQSLDFHIRNDASVPVIGARGTVNGFPAVINTLQKNTDSMTSGTEKSSSSRRHFDVEASIGDIAISVAGNVDTSDGNETINSEVSIHVNQLQDLAKLIQVELPALGPVDVSATVSGNLATLGHDGMEISGVNLLLDDKNLVVNGTGSFTGIPLDIKGDMQLDIKAPDTDELLRVVGLNRSLAGQLHIKAKLHAENKLVNMSLLQAQFESSLFNGHMSGTVTDILDSALATIDIDIEASDMSLVTQLYGQNMPPEWGPISASGQLVGSHGQYAIDHIVAKISGNSTATAKGSIASLMPFDDMHLDVDVNLFTLAETSAFTTEPLPDIGPLSGDGAVVWENGELSLVGAKASYDGSLGSAVVTGNIDDLIGFDKVRLKGDADLPDFKALDLFTGFTMPAVDRVVVSTDLISTEAEDLSARNLSVTALKKQAQCQCRRLRGFHH